MLIYPAIDLKDGQCVRLLHGKFDAVTVYDDDPIKRLRTFEAQGAEWVHIVDLDGAKAGSPQQHELIGRMAHKAFARIQTGGGVRQFADIERLIAAGAARVVVGSAAVERPEEVRKWIETAGPGRVCLALDVKPTVIGGWEIAVRGWQDGAGVSLIDALNFYPVGTVRHVLITDVSRDGALTGPNFALINEMQALRPDIMIQASGGVAELADLTKLQDAGVAGCIVGRAIYEGKFTLPEAIDALG